jgi:hypothetical protein
MHIDSSKEETFPPGSSSRSRCLELQWNARDSYFGMRVFLCLGLHKDAQPVAAVTARDLD